MNDNTRIQDGTTIIGFIMLGIIMILIGMIVLNGQEEQLRTFCENKTGIINVTGDFTEIDCDCWHTGEIPEYCLTVNNI